MNSQIIGKKIEKNDPFEQNNESKNSVLKIKFKNFNESKNKQEKSKKKISTSLKSKEKLIKTIDNILDFQIKTKQRIISFKKDNEKKSNSLEKKEKPYKSDNNLDIPEFLQKTKGRLAEHSKLTIKETMNRKNELNKKKETLEKLKLQAQKEISKIPQKKFDPKQKFNLNLEEITDFQKIENEIFNEIQPENFEIERLDMKENTKNVEAQKSLILNTKKHVKFCEKPINKEKKADSKNIKPNFNKKSEKINKMTLSITNPDYALLEKQIRQKEKEIEEYEKYLHNHTETNDMSKNKKNLFEDSKNNEKQTKKEFLKKINNKLMQDLPQFEFFGNQSQSDKSEKEADIKESNTFSEKERNKKIDFFLQSSKKNGKIERSPLDHLLLVNNIIERKKDNLSEKPYKNQFSEDFFDFEDFENDIEMYKKLYSEKLEKSIKKKDELEKSSFSSSSEDNYFTVKKLGVNKNKEIIWGSVNKENIQIESNCDFQFADKQFKDYLPINNKFNDILTKDAKELLQRKELNILDL